ncbi:MAG: hypothetical protein KBG20_13515 [Caldilineaceae bacterium]|nr:hypothetical protein [Caldilineaceae bacterium]MBP8109085.1 hypothetical protein [Caldilineaceae bacterium]MBP8124161.1 hypothetical protein [Caldilineaceae bacterium]MBP9073317.1 hypothetical protein [Caldilineaceae bacterium]
MALFQSTLPLILLLALAVITLLAVQMVRLRLELWANRRVIRALEQAGVKPETKSKSRAPELMAWSVLLLIVLQIVTGLLGVNF